LFSFFLNQTSSAVQNHNTILTIIIFVAQCQPLYKPAVSPMRISKQFKLYWKNIYTPKLYIERRKQKCKPPNLHILLSKNRSLCHSDGGWRTDLSPFVQSDDGLEGADGTFTLPFLAISSMTLLSNTCSCPFLSPLTPPS
jgi:hypothetical protein